MSQEIADDLARDVCHLFSSDWGIGITGYATAVPESDNQIFCHYAVVYDGQVVLGDKITDQNKAAFEVQLSYLQEILKKLAHFLEK